MTGSHVSTEPELEPDEGPAGFNWWRLARAFAILTIGILAVLALWQESL